MTSMVGNAFGVSTDPTADGLSLKTNMMIFEMMETAETIRQRLALLDATIGKLLADSDLQDRWSKFRKDVIGRSKERNRLSHAQWMISDDYPDDLVELDPKSDALFLWTIKDVFATLDRVVATRKEAHDLSIAIVGALHNGTIPEGELGPKKG